MTRFSEGMESRGDSAEKEHLGRFSDGQASRTRVARGRVARFSLGQEVGGETPEKQHRGRFSDGQDGGIVRLSRVA